MNGSAQVGNNVMYGTVKLVRAERGFGFVALDNDSGDVHLLLDRGIVPGLGWRSEPMWLKGDSRVPDDYARANMPSVGDRLALTIDPRRRPGKSPSAVWWCYEAPYKKCLDGIAARVYPVGAYYWPQLAAPSGLAETARILAPRVGRDPQAPRRIGHWDYERRPAMWSIVRCKGELPHNRGHFGYAGDPDEEYEWDSYLNATTIDQLPIVVGLAEYIRDELEPIRAMRLEEKRNARSSADLATAKQDLRNIQARIKQRTAELLGSDQDESLITYDLMLAWYKSE